MTDRFLRYLEAICSENIPADVYQQARKCFLDYLACAAAGANFFSDKMNAYLDGVADEVGSSSVIGYEGKRTMQTAALLNGLSAHVMELDDGHRKGAVHVGAAIFSALLSVAEKEHLDMKDVLLGAVVGYETTIRLACAVQPGNKLRGYHATGTCGTVGATMAIAAALHFDFEQMKSAFSAAVTSAAGVLEMQEDNADYKPLNVGRAAMDAVSAAYLGKVRFKPPKDALGGKRGFFAVMTDKPKTDFLTDFVKGSYCIQSIYNKPYASCRHTHSAIESAMRIRVQDGFRLDELESVCVRTYKLAVTGHDHTRVDGISSAKMSMPYSVAVSLATGKAGLDEFSEDMVSNEEILNVASKVQVVADDELTVLCPQCRAAIVEVKTKSGVFSARTDYPKGEPENPLTDEDFKEKVFGLLKFAGKSDEMCCKIWNCVLKETWNIDKMLCLLY